MKIPVMQIFRESFASFNGHKMSWLKLAFAPIMLYVFGFFVVTIATAASGHGATQNPMGFWFFFGQIIYFIISVIASGSLYINGYRYGILNEGGNDWWLLQINNRLVRLILYSILIGLIVIGFVLVGGALVLASHLIFQSVFFNVLIGTIVGVFGFYPTFLDPRGEDFELI